MTGESGDAESLAELLRRALDDEQEPAPTADGTYGVVTDGFGQVVRLGPIDVSDLVYDPMEDAEVGPAGPAVTRLARDTADPAEARLLSLRYVAAARAGDEAALGDLVEVLGARRLVDHLVAFLVAAWTELGRDPDQVLPALMQVALEEICEPPDAGSAGRATPGFPG